MYENNYNYIDIPEEKPSSGSAGKTIALILSVALIGGASGFGGAYLQNSIAAKDSETPAYETSAEETTSTGTAETTPVASSEESILSSLLNPKGTDGALTTKQIVEKVSPSVVGVHCSFETSSGSSASTGTGIILNSDGYIITNAHVVQTSDKVLTDNRSTRPNPFGGGYNDIFDYFFGGSGSYETVTKDASTVTIVLSNDENTEYEAEIIGADSDSDLAVLKIDTTGLSLTPAEFGNSDELCMGDRAIAIGYPLGLGLSTSEGIVSGLNRTLNVELSSGGVAAMTLIQTDAAINPGNSGGPLINEYGQVIGITSSKLASSEIEGMGFAIPITEAMPLISDLMNNGYVISPQIGITGQDINSAYMRYYNLPVDKGVMVLSVAENSGAEAAGITAGDVIVGADGKEITSMEELSAAKRGKSIGDKITLTLARADGNIDVEITLTGEENTDVN